MNQHSTDDNQNGTGLADVLDQVVIEDHYVHGHGGQVEECQRAMCVTWRRSLRERMPNS